MFWPGPGYKRTEVAESVGSCRDVVETSATMPLRRLCAGCLSSGLGFGLKLHANCTHDTNALVPQT